jgi:flagellar motility protein MotE (MotC chaperone)
VILKEIEKINQEIKTLSQRVNNLEESLLKEQVKIIPKRDIESSNLDKIIESANIAMEKFNKRMNS